MLTRVKRGTPAVEVLHAYKARVKRVQDAGFAHRNKEMKPFELWELFVLMAELHPVKRPSSVRITKQLIDVLAEREIVTTQDLYRDFGWNDRTVHKRLRILQKHGLVNRVSRKYYLATPRLHEFREKHMPELFGKAAVSM